MQVVITTEHGGGGMKNKIAGALFGMALGDAMGMPAELWGRQRARKFFGGKITELMDGPAENEVACNYKKGQFTDDTDQALSNGSAMRIAPIGCLFLPEEKEKIVDYVYDVSRATHTSDVTIAGAAMIATGVSSAIVNDDFEKVIGDILDIEELGYQKGCETFSARLGERTKIGLELAKTYRDDEDEFLKKLYDVVGAGVGMIESVPAAVSIAYYAQDPNRACLMCANLGGDTDTIGAMATAICGAFTGVDRIKKSYIETLKKQNNVDFDHYIEVLMKGRETLA